MRIEIGRHVKARHKDIGALGTRRQRRGQQRSAGQVSQIPVASSHRDVSSWRDQVGLANATQMPCRLVSEDSALEGADQCGLLNDVSLSRLQNIERGSRWRQIEFAGG